MDIHTDKKTDMQISVCIIYSRRYGVNPYKSLKLQFISYMGVARVTRVDTEVISILFAWQPIHSNSAISL